jgi:hypothetical protein
MTAKSLPGADGMMLWGGKVSLDVGLLREPARLPGRRDRFLARAGRMARW